MKKTKSIKRLDENIVIDSDGVIGEIKKSEEEITTPAAEGERAISGSTPGVESDDDVEEVVEDVIGNKPKPGVPFSIAQEVEKDAKAIHDIPPDESGVKRKGK